MQNKKHTYLKIKESQNPKRLVYLAAPSPENAERMTRMRTRLKTRTIDEVKTKIEELEAVSTDFNLGADIKTKLNAFLTTKGLTTIDLALALKGQIDQMNSEETRVLLEQVDDTIENVLQRVRDKKMLADEIKDIVSTGDSLALKKGLASSFETVVNAAYGTDLGNNDLIRSPEGTGYFKVMESINELRKFRHAGKGPENAKGTVDGIVHHVEGTNTNVLYNYWYEMDGGVPVLYGISSGDNKIHSWKANETQWKAVTSYPGKSIDEVKRLATADNFATARQHMAVGLNNQIREQALRLNRNHPFSRHIRSLRDDYRGAYNNSRAARVSREQGGNDFIKGISDKIGKLFDSSGGFMQWLEKNFGSLYTMISDWFSSTPIINRPSGAATSRPTATAPAAPTTAPSSSREAAPDRSNELLREGWSNELRWGTFTIDKNDPEQLMTKIKDKPTGIASRKIINTRFNGHLTNLNYKIDGNKIVVDPNYPTPPGGKFDQNILMGQYFLLIENTSTSGDKTYEKMKIDVGENTAPANTEVRTETTNLNNGPIAATINGVELGTLPIPRRGWAYRIKTGSSVAPPNVKESPGSPLNVVISGNQILFKTPASGTTNGIPELRPENEVVLTVELYDTTTGSRATPVSKELTLKVEWPADPTTENLALKGPQEGDNHFAVRKGEMLGGAEVLELSSHNPALEYRITGAPHGSAQNQDWFEVDDRTGKVHVKLGKKIPIGAGGSERFDVIISTRIKGKTGSNWVNRSIRVDFTEEVSTASGMDIVPQGLTNNTLPQSLAGVTAGASGLELITLNEARSGIAVREIHEAHIIDSAGARVQIPVTIDPAHPTKIMLASGTTLTPGSRVEVQINIYNESGRPVPPNTTPFPAGRIGTETITIQIPNYTPASASDVQLGEGQNSIRNSRLTGIIAQLNDLSTDRDRAVTRRIKQNTAKLDGQPVNLDLVGNDLRINGTAIPITARRRLTFEVEVVIAGSTVSPVPSYPHSIEINPAAALTSEMAKMIVGGSAAITNTLYLGTLGGTDKPPAILAEFPNVPGTTRTLRNTQFNNVTVPAGKIDLGPPNKTQLILDPSYELAPEGTLTMIVDITAPGQTTVSQPISILIRRPGQRPRANIESNTRNRDWTRHLSDIKTETGSNDIFVHHSSVDRTEIINNGHSVAIIREGTAAPYTYRIQSPSISGVRPVRIGFTAQNIKFYITNWSRKNYKEN